MKKVLLAIGHSELEMYIKKSLPDFTFVGEVVYKEALIKAIDQKNPDIVVIRETLQGTEKIMSLIYKIKKNFPKVRIVFVGGNRVAGDKLLAELVNYSIYDILHGDGIPASEIINLIKKPNKHSDVYYLQPSPTIDGDDDELLFDSPEMIEKEIIREIYVDKGRLVENKKDSHKKDIPQRKTVIIEEEYEEDFDGIEDVVFSPNNKNKSEKITKKTEDLEPVYVETSLEDFDLFEGDFPQEDVDFMKQSFNLEDAYDEFLSKEKTNTKLKKPVLPKKTIEPIQTKKPVPPKKVEKPIQTKKTVSPKKTEKRTEKQPHYITISDDSDKNNNNFNDVNDYNEAYVDKASVNPITSKLGFLTKGKKEKIEKPSNNIKTAITKNIPSNNETIVSFIGGDSGSGTTTLAYNTAVALAKQKKKVIFVEVDDKHPSVKCWLSLNTKNEGIDTMQESIKNGNFKDVAKTIITKEELLLEGNIEQNSVSKNYKKLPDGLDFLFFSNGYLSGKTYNPYFKLDKELIFYLAFQLKYDYVILDLPCNKPNNYYLDALIYSNKVFSVITQDISSVIYNQHMLSEFYQKGLDMDAKNIHILNKSEKTKFSNKNLQSWLEVDTLLEVPMVNIDSINANFEGVPLYLKTRSPFKASIDDIQKHIN